jgi:hypothetical protein
MPRRAPRTAPPTSTTIGCIVKGTGVNGSGTLICAAIAVSTIMNATAPARSANPSARVLSRVATRVRNVDCMNGF